MLADAARWKRGQNEGSARVNYHDRKLAYSGDQSSVESIVLIEQCPDSLVQIYY